MRVRQVLIGLVALGLLGVPLAAQRMENVPQAQQAPAAPAAALKVGVLDLQEALGRTKEGQKASEELQAEFAPRNAELQKLAQEIQEMDSRLRTQERTLSDDARVQLSRQLEQKRRAAQRLQEDIQADFQAAQNEHIAKIWANMQKVIDQYAREKGYTIVINSASANPSPVIYVAPSVEITDDLVRLYDQLYPVAAPPAKPAARPATPPPPQPQQQKPPQPPPQPPR